MSNPRQTRTKRFGTPEQTPHLRIICATLGPGKVQLLGLIDEEHSITAAARKMKMSYKRAWQLIEAINVCFQEPLVESITGGSHGGGSQLSPQGKKALALYHAIYEKSTAATSKELKRLHGMLKL